MLLHQRGRGRGEKPVGRSGRKVIFLSWSWWSWWSWWWWGWPWWWSWLSPSCFLIGWWRWSWIERNTLLCDIFLLSGIITTDWQWQTSSRWWWWSMIMMMMVTIIIMCIIRSWWQYAVQKSPSFINIAAGTVTWTEEDIEMKEYL